MFLFMIALIIIAIISCLLGFTSIYKKYKYNKDIEEKNNLLQKAYNNFIHDIEDIQSQINTKSQELQRLKEIEQNQESIANQSFSNYCDILDNQYKEKEKEYQQLSMQLENSYNEKYAELYEERNTISQDLDKIRKTRAAAIEAQRKEKEIAENSLFYSIAIEAKDRNDIQTLERVKNDLNNPRILSMLIWQTFFRDKVTQLCNNILGVKTICGIYKITNQITQECYIGQAVDVRPPLERSC